MTRKRPRRSFERKRHGRMRGLVWRLARKPHVAVVTLPNLLPLFLLRRSQVRAGSLRNHSLDPTHQFESFPVPASPLPSLLPARHQDQLHHLELHRLLLAHHLLVQCLLQVCPRPELLRRLLSISDKRCEQSLVNASSRRTMLPSELVQFYCVSGTSLTCLLIL